LLPDDDAEAKRALAERRATGTLVLPGLLGTPFAGWSKAKTALEQGRVSRLPWSIHDLRRTVRPAYNAAGSSPTPIVPWSIHDLRRTVATGLQRLGVRLELTEAVLNHISGCRHCGRVPAP
jgi:integrase